MASFVNATEMYSVVIALTVPLYPSLPHHPHLGPPFVGARLTCGHITSQPKVKLSK